MIIDFYHGWRTVDPVSEGYGEDDTIAYCLELGGYFLRVNDLHPPKDVEALRDPALEQWTWSVWGAAHTTIAGEMVAESENPVMSSEIAMLQAEIAVREAVLTKLSAVHLV